MQNKKDELLDLRDLFFRYLSEWKWFVVSIVCCLFIAAVYLKITAPSFVITANVVVKDESGQSNKGLSALKSFSFGFPGSMDVQDELHIISSFSIMKQAVKSMELYTSYTLKKYGIQKIDQYNERVITVKPTAGIIDTLSYGIDFNIEINKEGLADIKVKGNRKTLYKGKDIILPINIKTEYGSFDVETTSKYQKGKSYTYDVSVTPLDDAAESYQKNVEVGLKSKKSNVINLTTIGPNVEKNRSLLNKIIELYNQDALLEKNLMATNTAEFINHRLAEFSSELSAAEKEIESYKKENHIFDVKLESEFLLDQNKELQSKLTDVEIQKAIIDQVDQLLASDINNYTILPANLGIEEESVSKGILEYNTLVLNRLKLLENTKADNPVVVTLESQIKALRNSILQSVANVKKGLDISHKDLLSQNRKFLEKYSQAPTIERDFLELKRRQMIKEQLVVFLMEKQEENALTLSMSTPKARVIDVAYKFNKPVAPKKGRILIMGLILGFIIPILFFTVKDFLKTTFGTKEELEKLTKIPVLGIIGKKDIDGDNIVISKDNVTPMVELFRLLRTNVQFILNKKTDKVILVTSTQSGEGKSFFAINLALSFALMNKKVVLIGLDIRNPKITEYMHIKGKDVGITNYLSDEDISPEQISIQKFENTNLDIIPAGPVPPNPGELVISERLDELLVYLRGRYDYIFIDSAPVGMVSDSFSLDRVADMTLYVIRADYSPKSNVRFVESIVKEKRFKKLYLVLNGVDITQQKRYGYGYGYGYGKQNTSK